MSSFPPKNIIIFPCGGTANESKKNKKPHVAGGEVCFLFVPSTWKTITVPRQFPRHTAIWRPKKGGGTGASRCGPGVRLRHPTMRNNRTPPSQIRNRKKTRSRFSIHEYDRTKTFVGVLVPWHPQHWQSPP